MPSIRELEGWMTTAQVAERLGITRQRVLVLAREGRIRSVMVGGKVNIFDPESVEALAEQRGKP